LNEAMLAVASERIKSSQIKWQPADAQELPFQDESFDLVACQYGVMFFPDKPKAFSETARVLKKGCMFLFNTWDELRHNALSYLTQEVMSEFFPDDPPNFLEKGPFSFFNKEDIQQLLKEAGFSDISIDTVPITSTAASAEDCANGVVGGTPIGGFLKERNMPEERIKERIIERLVKEYGRPNLKLPMQAFVCRAVKN
jgi:ubiquinone/menaquinone biosynthesis C-methylase UbiE